MRFDSCWLFEFGLEVSDLRVLVFRVIEASVQRYSIRDPHFVGLAEMLDLAVSICKGLFFMYCAAKLFRKRPILAF
jgi:hypothetical protein